MREPRPAPERLKGRGAGSNREGRFESTTVEHVDDGWFRDDGEAPPHPRTTVTEERARSIISRNQSPDIPFQQSVNPYRGCEHGCVYCFARPSHAYLNLSPGLDFETRLYAKTNAVERLRAELSARGYRCSPITLGINTDGWQPTERRLGLSRDLLQLLHDTRHPVSIVTKSALIERDIDLLAPMAAQGLAEVALSVTTLDNRLAAGLEPRASAPHARLRAIRRLSEAGIPVGVIVAPVIPVVTDRELEAILAAAREAGATSAGYVLLRLPHEVAGLFREWLDLHMPARAAHVMSVVQQMRGGKDYDSAFGTRLRGQGPFADLLARRFHVARRRLGFPGSPPLDCSRFVPPRPETPQGELF
ncbi:PA0069 family radical SAM protein [Coralloluteibacterium thermophilus]|uniref:PA0069 family radical SAM protein n=1 Tax=Coralloluteibacterium thermophilum TaxID=2707049 RepID=A0ABV9NLD6_9GAMM